MSKIVNKNANNSIWRFNKNGKNKNTYLNSKFRYGFFNHCSKELSSDTLPCLYVLLRAGRDNKINQLKTLFNLFDDQKVLNNLFDKAIAKNTNTKFLKIFKSKLFIGDYNGASSVAATAIKELDSVSKSIKKKLAPKRTYVADDYLMICSSSAFRRLQDKAQVYSLEKHDFVRSRLTHSIEVAANCERIASYIDFAKLMNSDSYIQDDCTFAVRCAGLLHDIGNPPFGHFGEEIIKSFFKEKEKELTCLGDSLFDFTKFDGNAQAMRIATKLQYFGEKTNLCLTAVTLGALVKYPFSSNYDYGKDKFSFFQSEKKVSVFLRASGTFVDNIRNPLSLILEAADDISYVTADLEDAIHKGLLSFDSFRVFRRFKDKKCVEFYHMLKTNYEKDIRKETKLSGNVLSGEQLKTVFEHSARSTIAAFREQFIKSTADKFINDSSNILDAGRKSQKNKREYELLEDKYIKLKERLSETVKTIYSSKEVVSNEICGYKILRPIIEKYYEALLSSKIDSSTHTFKWDKNCYKKKYYERLVNYISKDFVENFFFEIKGKENDKNHVLFHKIHLLIDFISGMSDSYAEEICKMIE